MADRYVRIGGGARHLPNRGRSHTNENLSQPTKSSKYSRFPSRVHVGGMAGFRIDRAHGRHGLGEGTDGGRGSLIFGNAKAGKPLMQSAQESICR
jgi:hypothetical protein